MSHDEFMELVMMTRDYPMFLISKFLKLRMLRAESLNAPKKFKKTFEDVQEAAEMQREGQAEHSEYSEQDESDDEQQLEDELLQHLPSLTSLDHALTNQIRLLNQMSFGGSAEYKFIENYHHFK